MRHPHPARRAKPTVLLAMLCGWGGALQAQDAPAIEAQNIAQEVRVAPGSLSGKVLLRGTRENVGRQLLRLQRVGSPEISTLAAAPSGSYQTPGLEPGAYLMEVSDGLVIKLQVTRGAVIRTLDLVVPPGAVRLAPQDMATPEPTPVAVGEPGPGEQELEPWTPQGLSLFGLSTPASWAVIIAGTAAVAIPVAIAVSDSGSGGESIVSAKVSPLTR